MAEQGHAVLVLPGMEAIEAVASRDGVSVEVAAGKLLERRRELMAQEAADPYRFGWEPSIWKVCDALIDFPWCDEGFLAVLERRFGARWRAEKVSECGGIGASGCSDADTPIRRHADTIPFDIWNEFKVRMRRALGFSREVTFLLVLGGNRTGKSNYAAKRAQMMLTRRARSRVTAFHMSNDRSVEEQQPLFWHYMPPEYRALRKGTVEYVAYKEKVGFSEGSFVNRVGSRCGFKNYEQDRATAIEGKADDLMLPDELAPADWIDTMLYRLTDRGGHGILTFTPLEGYSLCVRMFLDGAKVVREGEAFLLPKDGGEPDVAGALGLSAEDFAEIQDAAAARPPRAAFAPQSEPEDCLAWLEKAPAGGDGQPRMDANGREGEAPAPGASPLALDGRAPIGAVGDAPGAGAGLSTKHAAPSTPAARLFESVPRVVRPVNEKLGVVFFHCRDNPFGNPKEVVATALAKRSASDVRVRCYGQTEKSFTNVLAKFSRRVHEIPDAAVPREGRNFHIVDPAGDRNFFMGWIRQVGTKFYVYREWPGNYAVPGMGVPGPWAVPSARLKGRNDGERGEGQRGQAWGLARYKFEIARIELWDDFLKWLAVECGQGEFAWEEAAEALRDAAPGARASLALDGLADNPIGAVEARAPGAANSGNRQSAIGNRQLPGWLLEGLGAVAEGSLYADEGLIEEWEEGSRVERVERRIVDSRAAGSPHMNNRQPVTLMDELLEMGLNVEEAPGGAVIGDVRRADGIQPVMSALDWDGSRALSSLNCPSLFVAESCKNIIFAMETWMNAEGQKGATKDPIDILRMFFLSEWADGREVVPAQKGFFYGRGAGRGRRDEGGGVSGKLKQWTRRAVR